MFQTNLKISLRNLMKNKLYSFINISGLTVGIASAILIFLWIQNEVSHDRFHVNIDRIYLMNSRGKGDDGIEVWNTSSKPMGLAIKKDYPEVEEMVRVNNSGANFLISNGDRHFSIHGIFADPAFFNMFSFPFVKGSPQTSLNSVSNIVLTEQLAKKLFGEEDAIGKTVKVDSVNYLTVTGVLKDLPANTSFKFEYILPWTYATKVGIDDESWGNSSILTFVMLKKDASLEAFSRKVNNIVKQHSKDETSVSIFPQPYKDAWLYSKVENGNYVDGRIVQVRMFTLIAIFILLIACINFTNLSTARSEKRAKEVGIRKVVGAQRKSLIMQFILESVLLAVAAGVFAIMIVQLCLPKFSEVVGKQLAIQYHDPVYWLVAIVFILVTGIIAGLYPALYLSSFQPIKVLKGTFRAVNALVTPRKVLVVLQFSFAIALIICTIIVKDQIKYAQNRDAGYSRDNMAFVIMFGEARKNYELIKSELIKSGAASAVAQTSSPLTESWGASNGFYWSANAEKDKRLAFNVFSSDKDFSATMNLKVLQGRNINAEIYKTDSTAVILNETAVRSMGLKNPVGTTIYGYQINFQVVGVVKDFIIESPYSPIKPMMIIGPIFGYNVVNFRVNPLPTFAANLEIAEKVFKKYNPEYPFNCRFYDKEYDVKFADEQRAGTLAALFAGLTIFISCLGLFGLATYMAEYRIKEIGIRKVLGASVASIAGLLSRDFLKLVAFSFVIASPIAWILMHQWLLNFSYRIQIGWWIFLLAGALSFVIAIATVSYQAIKAAIANPVKSLRAD